MAVAQSRPATPPDRASLARFTPLSADVVVNIHNPSELGTALRRAGAERVVPLLLGADLGPGPAIRTWLDGLVGAEHPAVVEGLMQTEIGVVSRSWGELSQGVLLARLPTDAALAQWLPENQRQETRTLGSESLFRTKSGMMVAVREGIAAFARRRGDGGVLRDTLRLISGGAGESLDRDPAFRELSGHLPAKPLGVIHLAFAASAEDGPVAWLGWPAQRRMVLGLYDREQRLDVAIRGLSAKPAARRALGTSALERFYRLPATTLAAWISTSDLRMTYDQVLEASRQSAWGRYLQLVESLRAATGRDWESLPALGPHLIVAWDESLEGPSAAPQLALLVESSEAQTVAQELDAIAGSLLPPASDGEAGPKVTMSSHLGTRLRHVPLAAFVGGDSPPLSGMLAQIELSWAAQGDWVILALSRDHLQRLLDAQSGLIPTLSNLPDVQLLRRRGNPTSLLIAQPDLAADVVERALSGSSETDGGWSAEGWLNPSAAGGEGSANRLGVAVRSEQIQGVAVVAQIYPDTPAFGKLEPEDWILGLDGQLLDLAAPNADLRKRWALPVAGNRHTFRILRGDLVQDVTLEAPGEKGGGSGFPVHALEALRELAAVGRSIRFATWSVHPTDPKDYSALATFRFADAPTP